MEDKFKFVIPGKPEYLNMVRLSISSLVLENGFSVGDSEDLKQALSEACRYIYCHGNSGFAREYTVSCIISDKMIAIDVENTCNGDYTEKTGERCLDCPKDGELTVMFIKSLVDKFEIFDKKIHIEKWKKEN